MIAMHNKYWILLALIIISKNNIKAVMISYRNDYNEQQIFDTV